MAQYISDFRTGNTKKITINYGTSKDITGWQFRFVLLQEFGRKPDLDITTTAGDHPEDVPEEGLAHILLTVEDTAGLKEGDYLYCVDRIIPGSPADIRTILPPIDDYRDKIKIRAK